eukprot:397219_1
MSNDSNIEIVHVVTYNKHSVNKIGKNNIENSFKHNQSRYFNFLLLICIGSTITIPTIIIFFIGIIFPFISIASQSLWQIALYIMISCILSIIICHCYRYETFELYFNNNSIQKRIIDNGWSDVIEQMTMQIEDANINTIRRFKPLPYVLKIAHRIDKNVLWFVSKTIICNDEITSNGNKITLEEDCSELESLSLINNDHNDTDIELLDIDD